MRKQIRSIVVCLLACTVLLTGCFEVRELEENQQDLIAEYSAGIMLKYSKDYRKRLVFEDDMKGATPGPTAEAVDVATEAPAEETESPETKSDNGKKESEQPQFKEVALKDLIHISGMDISYKGHEFCHSYPKGNVEYKLTAKDGEKLLVLKFQIKNTTTKKIKASLMKRSIIYNLDLDGTPYQPTIVIQANGGLNYLQTSLQAGEAQEALLVYDVPKENANPSSATLSVEDGDSASKIKIVG